MIAVTPGVVLTFAALIFCIGLAGVVMRRNLLVVLMCVELMLNAVNITFVVFGRELHDATGQMAVFFIMTVAAAESAVGLGLLIAMFRTLRSVNADDLTLLRD